ncbi:MAG: GNAT family N-acetyltransferase [Bacteroidaceae bacterium]|nr:GNAT family N-acetyltransferase [Bacteroidaceae bacterium]
MKRIIDPVSTEVLKSQLTKDKFLRTTNHGGNEIYVVDNHNAPDVIREIGRLREEAFRAGGGGTGRELDIDKFDTDPAYGYKQLVLWDPEAERIIGGYRYVLCDDIVYDKYGQPILTSSHMFRFSKNFINNYLEHTIELGRSFVTVDYQSSKGGAKSIFALDNLFDGLGALMVMYKGRMKYFFGKMTIYRQYPTPAREMIQVFLNKWFGAAKMRRVKLVKPARVKRPIKYMKVLKGLTFKEDYRNLKAFVSDFGVSIPPLVNSYMNLSPKMQYFGTGINDEFGDIYDSGILIPFKFIADDKLNRHVKTLKPKLLIPLRNLLRRKY